ncbi:MAG: hypothetical protein Q4G59_11105, partial [Planctomycetia bacterium]|nr:hypothetical protein [Planctomycetia bacterium]
VDDNTAGAQGGGIYASANITMVSSLVRQNLAAGDGAGIALTQTGTYLFKNSEISRNATQAKGGGLSMSQGQTGIIVNCTIVANEALVGGGLNLVGGANIFNSVIVENLGDDIAAASNGVVGKNSLSTFTNWAENTDCLVYDSADRDEVFEGFDTGNYRPAILSVMKDAGNNELFTANGPEELFDLAGRTRNFGFGTIDIGAYEYYWASTVLPVPASLAVQYDAESKENDVVLTWQVSTTTSTILLQWSTSDDFQNVQEVYVENTGTYDVPGLLSFTTYYFRAKAIGRGAYYDSDWSSSTSVDIEGEVKLTAPKVFSGQKDTASSVLLTWSPVQCALGYTLEYSASPRFTSETTTSLAFDVAGTHDVTGLAANTTYFFRIKSLGNGQDVYNSEWSSSIYVVTLAELAAPTVTSATVLGCTSIDFVLAPQEDASSYAVQYCVAPESNEFDEATAVTVDEYSNAFVVDGLSPGTKYLFRFMAKAKQGLVDSPWTSAVEYTTSNTLAAPVISPIKSVTTDSVTLNWSSVELASQYIVEYQAGTGTGGAWTALPPLSSDTFSTIISPLVSNTLYSFRVKATSDEQTDSPYSVVQSVKTQADTDVLLDNYYILPTDVSALVGTFEKNDCHVFQLAPSSESNNNDLFEIVKTPAEGDDPDL